MKSKKVIAWILSVSCITFLLSGCSSQTAESIKTGKSDHEPLTITAPFRNSSAFIDLVNEKYPEVNLEVIPYSGANTTSYLNAQLRSGDMPEICRIFTRQQSICQDWKI